MSNDKPARARRALFDDEHEAFRDSFRAFLESRVVPQYAQWERDGIVPRKVFREAGDLGFLGMEIPEEYGGGGVSDFRFNAVIAEEIARTGTVSVGINLHNDICVPYFLAYADDEQRRRWLPGLASGELIAAIAMTEPGTGSDLAGIGTTAILDGDHYVLNGNKTFISNGHNADLVIVAARTEREADRHGGLSLIVVERDTPGFERGRNLEKIGMHAQDTAELFFDNARVPAANLLGKPGSGFRSLVSNLAQERMTIAVASIASAAQALEWAVDYVKERRVFGRSVGSYQNTRFVLASIKTEVEVMQAFVDGCVTELVAGTLTPERAAMAKLAASELQGTATDRCLQLFGGYGYMTEYPIARAYVDARIGRIYGGTSEVMREIIGRSMGL
ncbi:MULTISPECIES: acyl-CoA dehydrogenase family protein [Rhodococcus]|uniref:Acyl-CoA dehydrogenase family protein n=1 Tax=Rhodococcus oxybenzonivorans TaxID=1990687 RepID=A0AAE4UWJ2_9NOCA|nr:MULTISPECIES: acyl-CoA dehydrogenase family protein [Rhodococcus]MDV7243652.1 acyl-CoA dehydrogenase family protein [Rhodococcus oxybenzonivorans]MDV7264285.1 acyl-CoA dehydrogenase family protein [Rhodococcus oxybenzonivorans]MDV7275106.1 acyl-CoA dehydrogenase family protein [Rhodococcus oxybenzonivorans]MDV7335344.1 acyl-CoA dehydrogenase family protein [Rhodococcus oxybenzonivorans]MDV7346055.1 acyl-CoA dehydrogenase family protein [Rhodococcus oxybenzonivorans]